MRNGLKKIFPPVLGGTLLSAFLGMNLSSQEIATWYTNVITGIIIGVLFAILYRFSISYVFRVKVTPIIIVFLGIFFGIVLGLFVGISISTFFVKPIEEIVPLIGETTASIILGLIVWLPISTITEVENPKSIPLAKLIFSLGAILGWLGGWIGTVLFNLVVESGNEVALLLGGIGMIIGVCCSIVIVSEMNKDKSSSEIRAG